ncbi:hypothetical protein BMS3Abin03_00236 [bacterium BMS3Abin03]|nr:hypothetical protein BMS3Abin03_00236 [bacterium BMS3Abin03]
MLLVKRKLLYRREFNQTKGSFKLCNFETIDYFAAKIIPMLENNFIFVNNVLVRTEIADTHFVCNLEKCRGACCTFKSEFGAPLKKDEIGKIDGVIELIKKYLSPEHIEVIDGGKFYEDKDGELLIKSVDGKACVFVCYENGIARCAIEKVYYHGKSNFKKPISCHLFPVRVADFGGDILRYEKIDECAPALKNGCANKITVAEFCEEPLSRLYGKQWYSKLKKVIGR